MLLAMTAMLSSCLTPTGMQRPAEMVSYGGTRGAGSAGIHTVLNGDTVYTVSQHYHLPLRDIITLNNLSAPYHLAQGYRLKLPPPNEYAVQLGDTLNSLSRLFGVSVSETAKLNNVAPPYALTKGMVLRLPSVQPKLAQEFAAGRPAPTFTMEQTADAAPVSVPAVESAPLVSPSPQRGEGVANGESPPVPAQRPLSPTGFPPQPKANPGPAAPAQSQKIASAIPASAAPIVVAPPVPPRSQSGRFMRPVDGREISGFGPKPDGLNNDGINIGAPRGAAVRAADNGVIAYTGSDMQGYGNLVLIRHAGRWMTAYAHMDKTLVKKGQVVKAGQSIGTVGSTGSVDAPQLHFEVRRGTEAIDPDKYL